MPTANRFDSYFCATHCSTRNKAPTRRGLSFSYCSAVRQNYKPYPEVPKQLLRPVPPCGGQKKKKNVLL